MKFNWRANWEILLVLVIIVAGIVITTIAAIRNKDKPLLPLAEDNDFSHPPTSGGFNEPSGSLLGVQSSTETDEVHSRRPPGHNLRALRNQAPFHRPQLHGLHLKNNTTNESTKYDDAPEKQIATDQPNAAQEDQYESSSTDSAPNQPQAEVFSTIKANLQRLQQVVQPNLRLNTHNRSQTVQEENPDAVYADQLSESVDLLDDIHTTRSSMGSQNQQEHFNLHHLHQSQHPRSQQLDQRHAMQQNQIVGQQHLNSDHTVGSIQPFNPTTSSFNHQLNQLLVQQQANANHRLEPQTFDADDMLTSYSRPPIAGTQPRDILLNSSHLINPALLSNLISAETGSSEALYSQHPVIQQVPTQNVQHQQPTNVPPQHHRRFAVSLPISMLLGDFLKLARPHQAQPLKQHSNYSSHATNQHDAASHKPQNSFLHQLRGLPGPLINLLQGLSPSSHGHDHQQPHDTSESSQYYHRISVPLETMAQSVITQSQALSPALPAFPAPKGITHSWIPPTSGGTYQPSQNANAEFVASNAAGFLRSNQQLTTKTIGEATPLGSQQHESFVRPATDSNQIFQQQQHNSDINSVNQQFSQPQVQHQHNQQPKPQQSQPHRINDFVNLIPEPESSKLLQSTNLQTVQKLPTQGGSRQQPMFNRNNILPQGGSHGSSATELINLLNFQTSPQMSEPIQSFGIQSLLSNPSSPGNQFASIFPGSSPLLLGNFANSQSASQIPINHRPYESFGNSQGVGAESAPKPSIATDDSVITKTPSKSRKKRSYKVNDQMSNYDEDEEDTDSDRPMSVVRLDGQPTNSGRVRGYAGEQQDRDTEDSQTSNSLRETNHVNLKQPLYKEMLPKKHINTIAGRNTMGPFEIAGSGLMNKLIGTASTREESEEELDDDDDAGNERRREELEDTDFGVVNEPRDTLRGPVKAHSNSETGTTHSRRDHRPDIEFYGHPGEETRTLKYGILGSGNYEVVNGGVYSEVDESTAAVNSVANYVRKPNLLASKMLAEQQANAIQMGYLPGARLSAGVDSYLRDASANPNGEILLAPLNQKHAPNPLLELIDASGIQMFDARLFGPLGIESSEHSVQATQQDPPDDSQARENQVSAEFGDRPSRRPDENKEVGYERQSASLLDEQVGPTSRQRHSNAKGGRSRHGNDQFNSYQILPSKKVTIFSDKDLDSAPSEMYSHSLREMHVT